MKKIWTKDNCKNEALKYVSRSEFQKKSKSAYNASIRLNILNDVCSHMKIIGNLHKRCIYVYEFEDNFIYVGLTYNLEKRHEKHLIKGSVFEHIKINNNYKLIQLTDYINVEIAKQKEFEFLENYKKLNFRILNKSKTGSIGHTKKIWTKDKCKKEALKYEYRFEFQKKSNGAYSAAFLNKWLDDICSHMKSRIWTKNKCKNEALKYNTKKEYRKNSSGSYSAALKNKWLDDICNHMITSTKEKYYWTYDKCKEEALKYKNRTEFSKKSSYAYKLSSKRKWINDFF